jgi:uncharacterized MnhB-related membrane protein
MTVSWWRRLLYSLDGWLIAAIVFGAIFAVAEELGLPADHAVTVAEIGAGVAAAIVLVLIFSLPGWLLAIPIVLAVRNIGGWRFWMYFALGSCIGPAWFLGMELYFSFASPHRAAFVPGPIDLFLRAAAVSCLTTLLYLLLLRRAQTVAPKKSAASEVPAEDLHY